MCASGNRIDIIVVMGSFRFLRRMGSVIVLIRGITRKRFQGKFIKHEIKNKRSWN